MIKLRKMTVTGFRGARFPLTADFTGNHRSISVFGENASGKSTLTDALEWFITDRVAHLWREDCKEGSLRNVLIGSTDPSEVTIEFSNGAVNTRRLNADLSVIDSDLTSAFQGLIASLRRERIFLRHAQISQFVQQSKSEKRKAVASIIGYDSLSHFRAVIQSTLNALQRDRNYVTAKQRVEEEKRRLLQLTGKLLTSRQMLYDQMNADLATAGFDLRISDKASYLSIDRDLRVKINQHERVEKKLLLDSSIRDIGVLRGRIAGITAKAATVGGYNRLVEERAAIGQIHLSNFLNNGARIIDEGYAANGACPLCLSRYDLDVLRTEVDLRLHAIEEVTKKLGALSDSVELLLGAIAEIKVDCVNLVARYEKLEAQKGLIEASHALIQKIALVHSDMTARFKGYDSVIVPEKLMSEILALDQIADKAAKGAGAESRSLHFTEYENKIIALLERLRDVREAFYRYDTNSRVVSSFETQILSLGAIFDGFVRAQNMALETVLEKISDDVARFYRELHPAENVDKVGLRLVGEEGVEFEYYFHGKPTYPPMKYLSESHLNSLGIVLFLASAKLFNRTSKFLVLDDIVTSFDVNHRRRLLRLIKNNFADWQVVLLTHEAFWFDMIKKELVPDGWIAREVQCDDENGIQLEPSANDLKAIIVAKRQYYDVSNDLRKLLEATLKEICSNCEVKVAFRYNDQNERRMSGELLSELRSTVNRKCVELRGNAIFSQLEGSNLIATIGSHDNAETITGGDIDVALSDVEALARLFSRPKCGRQVEARNTVAGKTKIACKCGGAELDWK